jgi:hypothetical protein
MSLNYKRVLLSVVAILVALAGIIVWTIAENYSGIVAMLQRDGDLHNQQVIAEAIITYMEKNHGRMPESLDVLVGSKLLPSSSPIYCSPYHYQNPTNLSYKESSYYIVPNKRTGEPGFYILRYHRNEGESVEDGYVEINALIDEARLRVENSHQPKCSL